MTRYTDKKRGVHQREKDGRASKTVSSGSFTERSADRRGAYVKRSSMLSEEQRAERRKAMTVRVMSEYYDGLNKSR